MREFDLLEHVFAANASLGQAVEVPPGDDMAVIRLGNLRLLAAVDQLVDGRHVRVASTPIELVGRKAVTRSLSDIAAMAAQPVATLAAVTLPPKFGSDRAALLFEAMRSTAAAYNCPLIGGDLAFHADESFPLTCSVTVLAQAASHAPVTRSGAKPGDGVYVTGSLGGTYLEDGSGRHLTFEPRINLALALAETLGQRLHAMIDISDGLGRDASHIAAMSNVQIQIQADRVPCVEGVDWKSAMTHGEDYELLFAATGNVPSEIASIAITRVGEVVEHDSDDEPQVVVIDDGKRIVADELGWQHES